MAEQKQAETSLKMVYLPFDARGGPLRMAAAYGGIKLEEEVIQLPDVAKSRGEGKRRWNGVPEIKLLDKDGKETQVLGQSNTCLRYIGKQAGLYPDNALLAALVDEVLDSTSDLSNASLPIALGAKDAEDKKTKAAEFCKEGGTLRYWLDKFVARIDENAKRGNKNGLFVGDTLTIADLKFSQIEFYVINIIPGAQAVFNEDKYKPLIANMDAVKKNDKIKAFLDEFANRESNKEALAALKKMGLIVV
eukprot:CAMPEP_0201564618 /NCGR_PEP_ID=MMETSP0190_2-20130828/3067_1 /ASSEMBLY_ACC=CAM_ASM_000263 /TAXON_ID=37353 /ORGANISM="Rosalina sp." /LENGTH=247 /DNA_ID=CAMNT_0047981027 /DNA_START=60 /DNA_END=803 /DNA_ORIENTATION=-